MVMIYVWLAVVVVSAIVEAFTLQMAGIWFVVGGLVALIMAACGVALEWQIIVFVIVSLVLLLALRRLCLRFILKKDNTRTNVDAIVGLKVKLLADSKDGISEGKIGDVVWTVVLQDGETASAGDTVEVVEVQGNQLIARVLSGAEKAIENSGNIKVDGDVTVPTEDTATVDIEHTTADIENATDTAEVVVPVTTAETEAENAIEQKETKRASAKSKAPAKSSSTKTKKQSTKKSTK